MSETALPPLSIAAIFREIASLKEDSFQALLRTTSEPDAYDAKPDRVRYISVLIEAEPEAVRLTLETLQYLYRQIHRTSLGSVTVEDVLQSYLKAVGFLEDDDGITIENEGTGRAELPSIAIARLGQLLSETPNRARYQKYRFLTDGPLPAAREFVPIIDLRPIMSSNNTELEELIPLIQMRIRAHSRNATHEYCFQLDRPALNDLRDALDLADTMLDAAGNNAIVSGLLTKISL